MLLGDKRTSPPPRRAAFKSTAQRYQLRCKFWVVFTRLDSVFYLSVTVTARDLGAWVRIPLKAGMFVGVFLCCAALHRQRPCKGLIPSYQMS